MRVKMYVHKDEQEGSEPHALFSSGNSQILLYIFCFVAQIGYLF